MMIPGQANDERPPECNDGQEIESGKTERVNIIGLIFRKMNIFDYKLNYQYLTI